MRTVRLNQYETIALPDEDSLCSEMVRMDCSGWLEFGRIGQDGTVVVNKDEWPHFVNFINQLDEHMIEHRVGAYAPEDA